MGPEVVWDTGKEGRVLELALSVHTPNLWPMWVALQSQLGDSGIKED